MKTLFAMSFPLSVKSPTPYVQNLSKKKKKKKKKKKELFNNANAE